METQSRFLEQTENIPEEIILEILSRLPVKSLLRFRCVCKMLFFDNENASKRLKMLGSCNGLFLVTHYADFYLWNPSTRESTKVLSLRTEGWPKNFSFSANPSGLCYDSSADDYKAVMAKNFGKATVVSFKRKYLTTATFHAGDNDNIHEPLSGPVINEKLHWAITSFGHDRVSATQSRIVSFNPLTDEFEEFPMPLLANNGEGEPIIKGLGVLDGCLCMTCCVNSESGGDEVGPGFIELLVMKEYGVRSSWTRILKVSKDFTVLSRGNLVPLYFTSHGEVVISSTQLCSYKLCSYNLEDMSQREIMIPSEGRITYQTSYAESLVSPAAYGHEEDWIVERLDEFGLTPRLWL